MRHERILRLAGPLQDGRMGQQWVYRQTESSHETIMPKKSTLW